jgi:hypothetical protein
MNILIAFLSLLTYWAMTWSTARNTGFKNLRERITKKNGKECKQVNEKTWWIDKIDELIVTSLCSILLFTMLPALIEAAMLKVSWLKNLSPENVSRFASFSIGIGGNLIVSKGQQFIKKIFNK